MEVSLIWMRIENFFLNSKSIGCVLLGVVFSLGVPPFHLWFLAVISLSIFFKIYILSKNSNCIFSSTLIFSFSFYLVSSYWIFGVFKYVIEDQFISTLIGLLSLVIISFFMAVLLSFLIAVSQFLCVKLNSIYCYILIPIAWVLSEVLRSSFLGGPPMHFLGYMVGSNDYLIQLASLWNVHLNSFFLVLLSLLMAGITFHKIIALCVLLFWFVFGFIRLHFTEIDIEKNTMGINVRLVNGAIPQEELLSSNNTLKVVDKYIGLSIQDGADKIDLFIWPESVVQKYIQAGANGDYDREYVTNFLIADQILITGAPRYDWDINGNARYYGSLLQLNSNSDLLGFYDKKKLVPWGEYVPYSDMLPVEFVNLFSSVGYSSGETVSSLVYMNQFKILPLICAEGHYPMFLSENLVDQNLIVMIGNEAWVEDTTEPSQYLVSAKFRAIESGLPVLLASNQGYLAIINKRGVVTRSSYTNKENFIDGKVYVDSNYYK